MEVVPQRQDLHRWLVSYDVSNDRNRLRVAHTLQGRGTRWLYSAFNLSGHDQQTLALILDELAPALDDQDGVLALRMCGSCSIASWGLPIEAPFEGNRSC